MLIVHGGGKIFTATLARMGIESRFVNGLRVTDRETRDVAMMVFGGLLNKRLAGAISLAGQPAVGISASDAACFLAEPMQIDENENETWSLSAISTGVNLDFLRSQWRAGVCRWPRAWDWEQTAKFTTSTRTTWLPPPLNSFAPTV